jgi:hypothetical protein
MLLALPRSVKFEGFTDRGMQHRRLDVDRHLDHDWG